MNILGFDLVRRNSTSTYPKDFTKEHIKFFEQVKPFTMTSIERVVSLMVAVEYISSNNIAGSIVECGVWKGGSMMAVASTLMKLGDTSRHLYLFDTFDGMTQPSEKDQDVDGRSALSLLRNQEKVTNNSMWCYASLDEVKKNLTLTGYPASQMHFIQGKVEETIPSNLPESIALLRLDTDWFESTIHELQHMYPKLIRGGILIIDDYGHWEGAKRAVQEYFDSKNLKPLLLRIDYTGRLIVKM